MDYPPRLQQSLGHFDLDPCAADNMPYKTADRMVTKNEDGLKVDWTGKRVWLNPPYGRDMSQFLAKMRIGIALLPSRTDTSWFHDLVLPRVCGIFFIRGRIKFLDKSLKEAGCPAFASCLCCYSRGDIDSVINSQIRGKMVFIK